MNIPDQVVLISRLKPQIEQAIEFVKTSTGYSDAEATNLLERIIAAILVRNR
jgi:deoxyribose-phosphate aldolase